MRISIDVTHLKSKSSTPNLLYLISTLRYITGTSAFVLPTKAALIRASASLIHLSALVGVSGSCVFSLRNLGAAIVRSPESVIRIS